MTDIQEYLIQKIKELEELNEKHRKEFYSKLEEKETYYRNILISTDTQIMNLNKFYKNQISDIHEMYEKIIGSLIVNIESFNKDKNNNALKFINSIKKEMIKENGDLKIPLNDYVNTESNNDEMITSYELEKENEIIEDYQEDEELTEIE